MVTHLKRLSEIAPIAPTSPSDQVVGVTGGSTDALFAISQIGTIALTANKTFFLSPVGSDSNDGLSIATPFATMEHAVQQIGFYDYGGTFSFFINVADGTYPEALNGPWILPAVKNAPITCGNIIGNDSNPQNVVFTNAGGFSQQGQYQTYITGLRQIGAPAGMSYFNAVIGGGNVSGGEGAGIIHNNVIIDTTNQVNCNFFTAQGAGVIDSARFNASVPGGVIVQGSGGGSFIRAASGGILNLDCDFVIFPASYSFGFATLVAQFGAPELVWQPGATTNSSGVTGLTAEAGQFATIVTFNGVQTDIPGNSFTSGDNTIEWLSGNTGAGGFSSVRISGLPTTADITPQTWGLFEDTSGGGVYLAYNAAGTIKKVALV